MREKAPRCARAAPALPRRAAGAAARRAGARSLPGRFLAGRIAGCRRRRSALLNERRVPIARRSTRARARERSAAQRGRAVADGGARVRADAAAIERARGAHSRAADGDHRGASLRRDALCVARAASTRSLGATCGPRPAAEPSTVRDRRRRRRSGRPTRAAVTRRAASRGGARAGGGIARPNCRRVLRSTSRRSGALSARPPGASRLGAAAASARASGAPPATHAAAERGSASTCRCEQPRRGPRRRRARRRARATRAARRAPARPSWRRSARPALPGGRPPPHRGQDVGEVAGVRCRPAASFALLIEPPRRSAPRGRSPSRAGTRAPRARRSGSARRSRLRCAARRGRASRPGECHRPHVERMALSSGRHRARDAPSATGCRGVTRREPSLVARREAPCLVVAPMAVERSPRAAACSATLDADDGGAAMAAARSRARGGASRILPRRSPRRALTPSWRASVSRRVGQV